MDTTGRYADLVVHGNTHTSAQNNTGVTGGERGNGEDLFDSENAHFALPVLIV